MSAALAGVECLGDVEKTVMQRMQSMHLTVEHGDDEAPPQSPDVTAAEPTNPQPAQGPHCLQNRDVSALSLASANPLCSTHEQDQETTAHKHTNL